MSLPDTIFIFGLALVIFGPKKLPEIGRQLGKLVLEFRRASNEFKMQIEEELNAAERADRQKEIAAQAAASVAVAEPASEALTIRPPSTGTTVSTEAPSRVIPVHEEVAELEAVAGEHPELADNGLQFEPGQDTLVIPPPSNGTTADTLSRVIPVDEEVPELEGVAGEHPELAGNGLQREPEQASIHHD